MHGLIVKSPYVDYILDGSKTWEIRGSRTIRRWKIALIKKGSGLIVGTCILKDVIGPLTLEEMLSTNNHCIDHERLKKQGLHYNKTYAWVLSEPCKFEEPIPYKHPRGAVIWVNLGSRIVI